MSLRVCVFGAGAIGSFLAARLAATEATVSCIARGAHLAAMRDHGLRLRAGQQETRVELECTDNPADLGQQDVLLVTLKAQQLAANAASIAALSGPDTLIVTVQNGLPWWYFYGDSSGFPDQHLASVDPDGRIWQTLGPERALGAIVYPAAEIVAPGVVRHISGDRFSLGEPKGSDTQRVHDLAALLSAAELKADITTTIRREIWLKLSVSAALNPLNLISGQTIGAILDDPATRGRLQTLIREAQDVAQAVDAQPALGPEELLTALQVVAPHKTSMLKDFEEGRTLELDALTGAVVEIGTRMGVPTARLTQLYAQAKSRLNSP